MGTTGKEKGDDTIVPCAQRQNMVRICPGMQQMEIFLSCLRTDIALDSNTFHLKMTCAPRGQMSLFLKNSLLKQNFLFKALMS